jgi:hypothetical protein
VPQQLQLDPQLDVVEHLPAVGQHHQRIVTVVTDHHRLLPVSRIHHREPAVPENRVRTHPHPFTIGPPRGQHVRHPPNPPTTASQRIEWISPARDSTHLG